MNDFVMRETENIKVIGSTAYSYYFDKQTGFFARWGTTREEDPLWCPWGPEIADIEISSAAENDLAQLYMYSDDYAYSTQGGCNGKGCKKFCYKRNTQNSTVHMSLHAFEGIMDKMPDTLTQIAFGVCDLGAHPEVWDIFCETRRRGVIPNVTINGMGITDVIAHNLSEVCGAVAVSINPSNKDEAYATVELLTQKYGMKQVNFHIVLAEDTVPFVKEVADQIASDKIFGGSLSKMNALVMLSFKDKGGTGCFQPITQQSYADVIRHCELRTIPFGFDSCSAASYMEAIKGRPNYEQLCTYVEPCESGLFSIYINVFGEVSACSFCEGEGQWRTGLKISDFESVYDLWNSPKMQQWRHCLTNKERVCPFYEIGV